MGMRKRLGRRLTAPRIPRFNLLQLCYTLVPEVVLSCRLLMEPNAATATTEHDAPSAGKGALLSAQVFFTGTSSVLGRRLDMPADLLTGLQINAGSLVATARPCRVSRADFQRLETTQDESQAKVCGHKRAHAAEGSLRLFQPMLGLQLSHHPNHRHPGTQSASARARARRN